MNIVYGGSFNPPSIAHETIVNILLQNYPLARVIILPVGNNYQKSYLINFNYRYSMLKLIFSKDERVVISDYENKKMFEGTLSSLIFLEKEYGKLAFVIGSDQIDDFDKWINYEEIMKKYTLIIFRRDEDKIADKMKKYEYLNPTYQVFDFNCKISSTEIRNDIFKNKNFLNEKVFNYIIDNKLYEVNDNV